MIKLHSLSSEFSQVRRLDLSVAIRLCIAPAEVISEKNDDVWLRRMEQGAWGKETEEKKEMFHAVVRSLCRVLREK